jgi:hypothetical protein
MPVYPLYNSHYQYTDFMVWLVTLLLVAFGFQYVKDFFSFVLIKLYEFFIQYNSL